MEKEGKYTYTKEAFKVFVGDPSRSIGVWILASKILRKMRKAPLTLQKQGSEETPQSQNAENADKKNAENVSTRDYQSEVGEAFGAICGELPGEVLDGDFRASFAGENRQKHLPPKLHSEFHHQTSLRGSGLWRALKMRKMRLTDFNVTGFS